MSLSPGSSLPEAAAVSPVLPWALQVCFCPLLHALGRAEALEGAWAVCSGALTLPRVLTTPCALSGVSHGFHPVAEATRDPPPCFPQGAVTPHAPQLCLQGTQPCDPSSELMGPEVNPI